MVRFFALINNLENMKSASVPVTRISARNIRLQNVSVEKAIRKPMAPPPPRMLDRI